MEKPLSKKDLYKVQKGCASTIKKVVSSPTTSEIIMPRLIELLTHIKEKKKKKHKNKKLPKNKIKLKLCLEKSQIQIRFWKKNKRYLSEVRVRG